MARRKDPGPLAVVQRIGRSVEGAVRAPHPGFIKPQLAELRVKPPAGNRYVHEVKLDGYRLQAHKIGSLPLLRTRSGLNWTDKFPSVRVGISNIPGGELIIDGEVVCFSETGTSNFSALQDDISTRRTDRMHYYAFDLLYLDGYDYRNVPQIERKRLLKELLDSATGDIAPVKYSEHFEIAAEKLFKKACALGLEGIVSKERKALYRSERNDAWLKVKCLQTGRWEVVGYKDSGSSLYLGKREGKEFLYAGKAGTGFTNSMILELGRLLKPITTKKMPLTRKPKRQHKIDHWIASNTYWAEVVYRDITADGLLRHVTFKGLYPSKDAKTPLVAKFNSIH